MQPASNQGRSKNFKVRRNQTITPLHANVNLILVLVSEPANVSANAVTIHPLSQSPMNHDIHPSIHQSPKTCSFVVRDIQVVEDPRSNSSNRDLLPTTNQNLLIFHIHRLINSRLPHHRILAAHPPSQRPLQFCAESQLAQVLALLLCRDVALRGQLLVLQLLEALFDVFDFLVCGGGG